MSRVSIRLVLVTLLGLVILPRNGLAQSSQPFLGEIILVSYPFAPTGWALCAGQLFPVADNIELFSLIGNTYGGDGVTTFAVPDLRGRVPVGQGQGAGLSSRSMGQTGGLETVTLSLSQIPSHTHTAMATNHLGVAHFPGEGVWAAKEAVALYSSMNPDVAMSSSAIANTGGGQGHENMQPFLVLNYIIAIQGVFPSQE